MPEAAPVISAILLTSRCMPGSSGDERHRSNINATAYFRCWSGRLQLEPGVVARIDDGQVRLGICSAGHVTFHERSWRRTSTSVFESALYVAQWTTPPSTNSAHPVT